jgi:hypothetical protein
VPGFSNFHASGYTVVPPSQGFLIKNLLKISI